MQYGTVISSDIFSFPHFAGLYQYNWITMCHLLLPIIFLLIVVIASCSSVNAAQNNEQNKIGKPHSTVLQLTSSNFDTYIQDPANGLWLLDFYAPWWDISFCLVEGGEFMKYRLWSKRGSRWTHQLSSVWNCDRMLNYSYQYLFHRNWFIAVLLLTLIINFLHRCGHCKKLAPVLDAVAPFLAG